MWGTISFWLRFFAVAWVVLIGIGAALQKTKLLPALPDLTSWVWVISLVILGVDNVGTLIARGIRRKRSTRQTNLETALMPLLMQLAKTGRVRFETLGASVYVPARWSRLRKLLGGDVALRRIIRFRPSLQPQQSGISWGPAVGAVGDCWVHHATQYRNIHALSKILHDEIPIDRTAYDKLTVKERDGFSLPELNAIGGKYSEVLAEPIWHPDKGAVIGVLSIDRSFTPNDDSFAAQFEQSDIMSGLPVALAIVARTLRPAAGS